MNKERNINFYKVFIEFYKFSVTDYEMKDYSVLIGLAVTGIVFLIKDGRKVFNKIKSRKENYRINNELQNIMDTENVSFEKAKEILMDRTIIEAIGVSKKEWIVRNDLILKQGSKISFVDKEVGFIQGVFIGLINPEAVGYSDIYVIKKNDNTIRQAPIVYVQTDTINTY